MRCHWLFITFRNHLAIISKRDIFTVVFTSGLSTHQIDIHGTMEHTHKSANLVALWEATTQFKFKNRLYELKRRSGDSLRRDRIKTSIKVIDTCALKKKIPTRKQTKWKLYVELMPNQCKINAELARTVSNNNFQFTAILIAITSKLCN